VGGGDGVAQIVVGGGKRFAVRAELDPDTGGLVLSRIDKTVENRSPEFKKAYQAWRAAEIKAGTDPVVTDKEFAAIANLNAIRMAVSKFRLKNDRPPTLRNIATLPANPITGQKTVTRSGVATAAHGWSYDEYTGRVRIVLPEGSYAGLNTDEIELIKGK